MFVQVFLKNIQTGIVGEKSEAMGFFLGSDFGSCQYKDTESFSCVPDDFGLAGRIVVGNTDNIQLLFTGGFQNG